MKNYLDELREHEDDKKLSKELRKAISVAAYEIEVMRDWDKYVRAQIGPREHDKLCRGFAMDQACGWLMKNGVEVEPSREQMEPGSEKKEKLQ